MSINLPNDEQVVFELLNIAAIDHKMVELLARNIYKDVADFTQEMILDAPDEYPTKDAIEAQYANLTSVALDFANDFIEDLKYALNERIRAAQVECRVRTIQYNRAGVINDFSVDIDFQ